MTDALLEGSRSGPWPRCESTAAPQPTEDAAPDMRESLLEESRSGPWPPSESLFPCHPERSEGSRTSLTNGVVRREVVRTKNGTTERLLDHIAEEVPVALIYNDHPFAVMMATPADLHDFALGFTITESIASFEEVASIEHRELLEGHELRITIPESRASTLSERRRNLTGRSGCGICGTEMLEAAMREPPRVPPSDFRLTNDALDRALAQLPHHQPINALTGATHAAAWSDADGNIVLAREDVGRHNALDKLVGAMAELHLDRRCGFVMITSRSSYEIIAKVATAGIANLAAISAPTALALAHAQRAGMTLVAFVRPGAHSACHWEGSAAPTPLPIFDPAR